MSDRILVAGATGNVGSKVFEGLIKKGTAAVAGTRKPEEWKGAGSAVKIDFDDSNSWDIALKGVNKLFLLVPPLDPDAGLHAKIAVDAAKKASISKIVFLSAIGIGQNPNAPLFAAEQEVKNSTIPWTILRPNFFSQNFFPGYLYESIKSGTIYLPAGEGKTSFIDTRDIADAAVETLLSDTHNGKEYTLTAKEALSHGEVASVLSRIWGREISYVNVTEEQFSSSMKALGTEDHFIGYMLMLYGAVKAGYVAETTSAINEILGRDPITFTRYAEDYKPQ